MDLCVGGGNVCMYLRVHGGEVREIAGEGTVEEVGMDGVFCLGCMRSLV